MRVFHVGDVVTVSPEIVSLATYPYDTVLPSFHVLRDYMLHCPDQNARLDGVWVSHSMEEFYAGKRIKIQSVNNGCGGIFYKAEGWCWTGPMFEEYYDGVDEDDEGILDDYSTESTNELFGWG